MQPNCCKGRQGQGLVTTQLCCEPQVHYSFLVSCTSSSVLVHKYTYYFLNFSQNPQRVFEPMKPSEPLPQPTKTGTHTKGTGFRG
jgi:hypothetical protein